MCADPRDMPFSNQQDEGFENKLAHLFATKLDKSLSYTWYPQARGYRPQHAGRAPVRRHHGLPAGQRPGAEHQPVLSVGLRAGVQAA